MLYKYRYHATIFTFLALLILGNILFGYTGCRDGWSSPSIGTQGACSHHGGVTSNFGLIFIIVGAISFRLYSFVNSRYRVYGNIVVSDKFPPHPLEEEVTKIRLFKKYLVPIGEAKSRKNFQCNLCEDNFSKGKAYMYAPKGNYRIKYCSDCASWLPVVNKAIEAEEAEYSKERVSKLNEIKEYYLKNAKAVLN